MADELRDELLRIPDVAKVSITGEQKERVYVEYDNARLTQFGLSPLQLGQILQKRNIILPGGDFTSRYEKIVLEPTGNFTSIDDLRQNHHQYSWQPRSGAFTRCSQYLSQLC